MQAVNSKSLVSGPVLGVESSCDETGVAIYQTERGLIADALYSQVALHAEYGGVVPELASRDHVRKLLPLLRRLLADAGLDVTDLAGVAYTAGPGLIGALLVGASLARSLAWALEVPAIGVHHMEGHLLAPLLEPPAPGTRPLAPPFVALLVSGGHSLLVGVPEIGHYAILGDTLDDAAGEAFDKVAKMLELPYPGGPAVAKLAESGDPKAFHFSRPMTDRPGLDLSFSGLKTQVLLAWRDSDHAPATKANIARGFEDAIVDTLAIKCQRALDATGYHQLVVSGGVGANQRLRARLVAAGGQGRFRVYFPRLAFCTDNGAMIALAGSIRLAAGQHSGPEITVRPRWRLETLPEVA